MVRLINAKSHDGITYDFIIACMRSTNVPNVRIADKVRATHRNQVRRVTQVDVAVGALECITTVCQFPVDRRRPYLPIFRPNWLDDHLFNHSRLFALAHNFGSNVALEVVRMDVNYIERLLGQFLAGFIHPHLRVRRQ